jgi:preprotein translocase subunit SecF
MEFFHGTNIDFIGKRIYYFIFTILLFVVAVGAFIQRRGPVLGIEFTGGTLLQVGFKELPPIDTIRGALTKEGWEGFGLQTQPVTKSIVVRVKSGNRSKDDISASLLGILKNQFPGNVKDHPDRVDFIGPVIGKKLIMNTLFAILGSLGGIMIYVAIRFKNWIWGFSGVLALAHDVFISWGLLTLLNRETTLVTVAALLTLAGYSINDTIVVFDRVRETLRTSRKETMKELYNRAINETLGRTINTSLTVFVTSLCLLFLGGDVLRDFSLIMAFGTFIGTYSSVAVALSLVYELENRKKR